MLEWQLHVHGQRNRGGRCCLLHPRVVSAKERELQRLPDQYLLPDDYVLVEWAFFAGDGDPIRRPLLIQELRRRVSRRPFSLSR